jgi:hypothetical protein
MSYIDGRLAEPRLQGIVSRFRQWWARPAPVPAGSFCLARGIFLRSLGLVYLAAFLSLWVQVDGLIGSRGILPVSEYLAAVHRVTGTERYYLVPTLCWLDAGDGFLHGLCAAGVILSVLLIVGLAPVPVLFLLWVCYLSLTVAGQQFLSYQWDALLLETGFLAIFFAPLGVWPQLSEQTPPRVIVWLLRWLLFRLMFMSGVVKLLSGDPTWRDLTALHYHYETQPLPTWTSWYMHQLPGGLHRLAVLATFVAELLVPLLIFGPRRARHVACAGIVGLQLLIAATGNYGFFNLLTIVLCVPLLDDGVFPARWRARLAPGDSGATAARRRSWSVWVLAPVAGAVVCLSVAPFLANLDLWPGWLARAYRVAASFRSVNTYGLFAVMTTQRPEIVVEGSNDGQVWRAYEFRWKPGDVHRRPAFTGLHLPRLDWQMWFAALGDFRENPWVDRFLARLLQGTPEVLALLEQNPFPDRPPRYVRALVYEYHFTNFATRRQTGAWWRRELRGHYSPVLVLPERQRGQREQAKGATGVIRIPLRGDPLGSASAKRLKRLAGPAALPRFPHPKAGRLVLPAVPDFAERSRWQQHLRWGDRSACGLVAR